VKEALKLALETLRNTQDYKQGRASVVEAVEDIKAALAQPAQQEPVAWWDEERDVLYRHCTHDTDDYHKFKRTVPLYAHPPQRTWVGLTEEEIQAVAKQARSKDHAVTLTNKLLKEKNT
jgi:hypothetical protein